MYKLVVHPQDTRELQGGRVDAIPADFLEKEASAPGWEAQNSTLMRKEETRLQGREDNVFLYQVSVQM